MQNCSRNSSFLLYDAEAIGHNNVHVDSSLFFSTFTARYISNYIYQKFTKQTPNQVRKNPSKVSLYPLYIYVVKIVAFNRSDETSNNLLVALTLQKPKTKQFFCIFLLCCILRFVCCHPIF